MGRDNARQPRPNNYLLSTTYLLTYYPQYLKEKWNTSLATSHAKSPTTGHDD